ncbi:hypothetical protein HAX54_017311 [Datura stramonium]|uniref:Uncharacterized protein n=1 Tax=Datura stramonium TaxID=4076 RepID=A0ABS8UM46_DATST|nr:hypothetical protein [Datura stramonium]
MPTPNHTYDSVSAKDALCIEFCFCKGDSASTGLSYTYISSSVKSSGINEFLFYKEFSALAMRCPLLQELLSTFLIDWEWLEVRRKGKFVVEACGVSD